jgi:hypothetical protein
MPLPVHITLPAWCKEFVTARVHRELRHFNLSSGFREESIIGRSARGFLRVVAFINLKKPD